MIQVGLLLEVLTKLFFVSQCLVVAEYLLLYFNPLITSLNKVIIENTSGYHFKSQFPFIRIVVFLIT
jgi:hypothetical protein